MVFFLRHSPDRRMMEHSALPLPVEGNERRRVKRSLCSTCVQPPDIRRLVCKDCAKQPVVKTMKSKKVTMGRKGRLQCKARGKPAPKISWFKSQIPITSGNGGVTIRTTALTSTLIFSRTTSAHSGQYTCIASNEVGRAQEVVTLEVSRKSRRRQKEPANRSVKDASDRVQCEANLCINGGTCFFSPSLNLRQCVCTSGFEGVRCENVLSSATIRDSSNNERGNTATRETVTSSIVQTKSNSETEREKARNMTNLQTPPRSSLQATTINSQSSAKEIIPTLPSRTPVNNVTKPVRSQTSNNVLPTANRPHSRPSTVQRNSRPKSRYSSNGQVLSSHPVRRKSSLKIIPCKDKNFCSSRGKCRYISKLDKKFCQCRKGYGGAQCEHVL